MCLEKEMRKVGQNTLHSLPPVIKAWLTSSSLMGSRTAVVMKNEKSVRGRAAQACHCQRQCVLCSQATWSSLRKPRKRETDREGGSEEGRGGSCGEKWSGAAIPRRPGNQRLFQRKKYSQWQTPAIVFRHNHMSAKNTTPSLCTETRSRKEQDEKRGKTETRGTIHIEVFRKTQPDHQQFTPLHEGRKYSSLPTIPSFLAAVVARQVVPLFLQLAHLNTI